MTPRKAFGYAALLAAFVGFALALRTQQERISALKAQPAETVRVEVPKTVSIDAFRLRCGYVPRTSSNGAER